MDAALQKRVVADEGEIRGGFWVADEELVFRSHEQHGEGGFVPARPHPVPQSVAEPVGLREAGAVDLRQAGLLPGGSSSRVEEENAHECELDSHAVNSTSGERLVP